MGRIAWLVTGRRRKYGVVAGWAVLIVLVVPFAGRLFDVVEDTFDTFLPDSAESKAVLEVQQAQFGGGTSSVVVVYQRPAGGIIEPDRALAAAHAAELGRRYAPQAESLPIVPSGDGAALLFQVPVSTVDARDVGDVLIDAVRDIRATVAAPGDGLEILVTGPGATSADRVEVFEGLEATLLLAPVIVVAVLLLLIYRSPVLFLVPLFSVVLAYQVASALLYGLVDQFHLTLNSLGAGVLGILVYALGTDYALLLIARYRQELRHREDRHEAMRIALTRSGPAILASAGTVGAGLLCFLLADQNANRALGPIGVVAALATVAAMTTLLPAVLLVLGRGVFWPAIPRYGTQAREAVGWWQRVASLVARRPRAVWVGVAVAVGASAVGVAGFNTPEQTPFRAEPESVAGQAVVAAHYFGGAGSPVDILAPASQSGAVEGVVPQVPGVLAIEAVAEADGVTFWQATLAAEPDTPAAYDTIEALRGELAPLDAIIGGPSAVNLDRMTAAAADTRVLIPVVLIVVLLILFVLLRALTAPLLMVASLLLSFGAALGLSVLVFENLLGWSGQDAGLPLLAFVFLAALGVDYNIFLMSRIREEAVLVGTAAGTVRGLVLTGGVITSAGVVLAATFSVLVMLPVISIAQLGFVVAVGVLLDALVVRTLLMPALTLDVGRQVWWPSRLSRAELEPCAAPGLERLSAVGEK